MRRSSSGWLRPNQERRRVQEGWHAEAVCPKTVSAKCPCVPRIRRGLCHIYYNQCEAPATVTADPDRILAMAYHVSKTKFAELVEEALAELPEQFANFVAEAP